MLGLRRSQHERMPSLSTYNRLRRSAEAVDAWAIERDAARAVLRERDPRSFVEALLGDGEAQLAWDTAHTAEQELLGNDLWLRLAESRQAAHPADAVAVYQRVADRTLEQTDRRAYAAAVRILKHARDAAKAAHDLESFSRYIATLREQQCRRPTMIAMLDSFRDMLEDLGGGLGVTDPVSGEAVAEMGAPKPARPKAKAKPKKARKAPKKKKK